MSELVVPFNSVLETGLRSACILSADTTISLTLNELLAFDHLVVHTGDLENAPQSLHPDVSHRNGELLIRRPLVEKGLLLMESKNLVERQILEKGFFYTATEFAPIFIESLRNQYATDMNIRAKWAIELYKNNKLVFFEKIFNNAFGRWSTEFKISDISLGNSNG